MNWVNYLKFLSVGKFMLIDYLTLNYIFTYFWIAIWLSYQLFIHACSEAHFRENCFSTNFSSVFSFQYESSERTYSWVRTLAALSINDLAVCRPDKCVPRPYASPLLSLQSAQHCIFSYFYHIVCFCRRFLPRFWHSLHISSHSMIFSVFSFVLLSFSDF
jgi:hypothetical protein